MTYNVSSQFSPAAAESLKQVGHPVAIRSSSVGRLQVSVRVCGPGLTLRPTILSYFVFSLSVRSVRVWSTKSQSHQSFPKDMF